MEFLERFLDALQRNPGNMCKYPFIFQHGNTYFLSFFSVEAALNNYSGDTSLAGRGGEGNEVKAIAVSLRHVHQS